MPATRDELTQLQAELTGRHHGRAIEVACLINIVQGSNMPEHPSYRRYHKALTAAFSAYLREADLDFSEVMAADEAIQQAADTVQFLATVDD